MTDQQKLDAALAAMPPHLSVVSDPVPFSWDSCMAGFDGNWVDKISQWRGYRPEFVRWLAQEGMIGVYRNNVAFPVHDHKGEVIGCHYRIDPIDGGKAKWIYNPSGMEAPQWVIGDIESRDQPLVLFESQWDALALMDATKAEKETMFSVLITRGCSNWKGVPSMLARRPEGALTVAYQQNDPEPAPGEQKKGNSLWVEKIVESRPGVIFAKPPDEYKDLNDWYRENPDCAGEIITTLEEARRIKTFSFTIMTASEILAIEVDPKDVIMADGMLEKGNMTSLMGMGGTGKSRFILQCAMSMIFQQDFLGWDVSNGFGMKWLFMQTENGIRRLQMDIRGMLRGMDCEHMMHILDDRLFMHVVRTQDDGFFDLETEEHIREIKGILDYYNPDFVVWDPLYSFVPGDLNSDRDMITGITRVKKLSGYGNLKRIPIMLHHAGTGKSGVEKAVGWDSSDFGRNSKALRNLVRSQFNLAPADADDHSRLVLSCGKINDAPHFYPKGLVFNDDSYLYEIDPEFTLEDFRESLMGKKKKTAQLSDEEVSELVTDDPIAGYALAELIQKAHGVTDRTARSSIRRAVMANFLNEERKGKAKYYTRGIRASINLDL